MKLLNYLQEKLTLQQIREYVPRNWNKKRYNDIFKGKYRLYLELEKTEETDITPKPEVTTLLSLAGYKIINYKAGLCAKKNDDRPIRIGKIIQKLKQRNPDNVAINIALKAFQSDSQRTLYKQDDLMVVISRHPYDIAGMSTDRGWTSCVDLESGCNKDYIPNEIKAGTLVAYLIKKSDPNIEKPIARLLLKPYINDKSTIYLGIDAAVYGTAPSGFKETVEKWLNSVQSDKNGLFTLNYNVYASTNLKTEIITGSFGVDFEILLELNAIDIRMTTYDMLKNWDKVDPNVKRTWEHAFSDYNLFKMLKKINYDVSKCNSLLSVFLRYVSDVLNKKTFNTFPKNLAVVYVFLVLITNTVLSMTIKSYNAKQNNKEKLINYIKNEYNKRYDNEIDTNYYFKEAFPYIVDALKLKVK
jgi:hypothetical protein